MNGMIFAAGLGTRLRPLTNDRPKALVEVGGKTLLERVILKMKQAGIYHIVVNVHHYAGQIEAFLRAQNNFGCDIVISDEREKLLDTGGGLLRARDLFLPQEPVLIHNVDIFSAMDLSTLIRVHRERQDDATLLTGPALPGRGFRFDKSGWLKGWENTQTGERKVVDKDFETADFYNFCGIQVVSPQFLQHISRQGVFSVVDEYLSQARQYPVRMYYYEGYFLDLGTPEAVARAEEDMKRKNF